jgi:hypothetical protein
VNEVAAAGRGANYLVVGGVRDTLQMVCIRSYICRADANTLLLFIVSAPLSKAVLWADGTSRWGQPYKNAHAS